MTHYRSFSFLISLSVIFLFEVLSAIQNPKSKIQNRPLIYWLPPIAWMAIIFWFSTDSFSARNTGSYLETLLQALGFSLSVETLDLLHFVVRKGAHLTAYAILAWLLFRAIRADSPTRWRLKWAVVAMLITAGYAFLDEYHQSLTTQRAGTFADSLLDILGGLCGLVILKLSVSNRQVRDREI